MTNVDGTKKDRFGNAIDPTVGYARGKILASSVEEHARLVHGQRVATARLAEKGKESISVFTGNQRVFPVRVNMLDLECEEWLGPGLIEHSFQEAALNHVGGTPGKHTAALFNRTSGGLVAAVGALSAGKPVVSAVPKASKSHASVSRGCFAARVDLFESDEVESFKALLAQHHPRLALITTVSSNLDRIPEASIREMIGLGQDAGAIVLVDDAYGARMRPILHGGQHALEMGADLVITNCDKAGMIGPRAGLLVGVGSCVQRVAAKAAEFGMEARAPIVAAVEQSLRLFDPAHLREEAEMGKKLTSLFEEQYGREVVHHSDLGPIVLEEDLFEIVARRANASTDSIDLVPSEVSSALGVILLRDHGVLTTNTHGQPGAKVSLRLRPTPEGVKRLGGLPQLVQALEHSVDHVASLVRNRNAISNLIIGRDIQQ